MAASPPTPRRRLSTLLAALVSIAAACGPATPTATVEPSGTTTASLSPTPSVGPSGSVAPPTPTADPATVYAAIKAQVVEIRGLEPRSDVEPQVLDEQELKVRVEKSFNEDNPPELIAANEQLLKGMGMLGEEDSLRSLYLELRGSQVAGFYSPEDEKLYVVSRSGGLGVAERVTFSHEYTHALQDQHFDLESFDLAAVGQGDRSLASLSLIEGDATLSMSLWLERYLTAAEKLELVRVSLDPDALAILEKMPPILRDSLAFPYDAGLRLVIQIYGDGGWPAVDEAFSRPPSSTEQVMHPEKYAANEVPRVVDIPDDVATRMGAGWKVGLEDTLGEFQLAVWLRGALDRVVPADEAAAGWGGDRVLLLQGPNDAWAIALLTEWDTTADATEFADAAGQALATLSGQSGLGHQADTTVVSLLFASDAASAVQLDTIMGLTGN
ncbi:MAG TPA: hypothetical protein VGQ58_10920 [Candidatus Limnocylindrales bacterium]|nr:hypothetical protein [Candidatus Limnocylindrales bacterium]